MPYQFKFPFEPPWEDLKMTVDLPGGGKVYIFDTCVERDPKRRAEIDRRVGEILGQAEERRLTKKRMEEETG